jgi:hypothetical protein
MVYGPAPRRIIGSLQNGDCSEKGGRFCGGWWRLLSESLLEILRDEAAGAGIISWRMPKYLSAQLLSNKGREKLYVAPIVFLSNQGRGRGLPSRAAWLNVFVRFAPMICPMSGHETDALRHSMAAAPPVPFLKLCLRLLTQNIFLSGSH